MKESPRSRPQPDASFASRAEGAAEELRSRAGQLWSDFRRADRFFKMRAGIVAAWALLSVATLWGACSSTGTSGPTGSIGAEVQLNRDSIMGVQLLVRNESHRIWEDVTLTLDDGWSYQHPTMRPQDLVVLPMTSFKKGEQSLPRDYVPRSLSISCRQGSDRIDLHQEQHQ